MMGSSPPPVPGAEGFALASTLLEAVRNPDTFSERLKQLEDKTREGQQALAAANETHRRAKEREDSATAKLTESNAVLVEAQRLAAATAAKEATIAQRDKTLKEAMESFYAGQRDVEATHAQTAKELAARSDALKLLENAASAKLKDAVVQADSILQKAKQDASGVVSKAQADAVAAKQFREVAEIARAEAVTLKKTHEERLAKLVAIATGA